MSATITWYLQGTSDTEIAETDTLKLAGATINDNIVVDEYNDSTHVKTSAGANKSDGNTPNNNKFISQDGGTGGDSQADWGDGTEDLDQITNTEAVIKINLADTNFFSLEEAIVYAYDGVTTTTPPTNITTKMAEVGDTNFTTANGYSNALAITDQVANTTHDIYLVLSMVSNSAGIKSGKIRFEGLLT